MADWDALAAAIKQAIDDTEAENFQTVDPAQDFFADKLAQAIWENTFAGVGAIQQFAQSSVPQGWLECDGSAISRTTYARLFAKIGTDWGVGDGSTTFNIPDLQGFYLVGLPDGGTLGGGAGTALTDQENRAVGQHNHGVGTLKAQRSNVGGASDIAGRASSVNNQSTTFNDINISGTTANTGSVAGTPAPYKQVLVCIKI